MDKWYRILDSIRRSITTHNKQGEEQWRKNKGRSNARQVSRRAERNSSDPTDPA